ncbi:MAG TPA: NADH:flavin oxidoreductase [Polyangia bacterium]|jgi:2,4-dienoyl-CoA reductase-like NADH-dependent reductase (Old Yellow Enzyme family)
MIKHALPDEIWPSAAEAARARLFSPVRIGARQARTRTWVPAMVPWRASDDGVVTPALVDWYGRFAEGQPGVLVVEATGIRDVPSGPLLRIGDDRFVPGLRALCDEIRRRSDGRTLILIQLLDFLAIKRRPDPTRYFAEFLVVTDAHRKAVVALTGDAAMVIAGDDRVRRTLAALPAEQQRAALTAREWEALTIGLRQRVTDTDEATVRTLPQTLPPLFAAAAARAQAAGFDGVEVHAAHAYTLASFLSAQNTRSDGFGGAREDRQRVPVAVLQATRAATGEGFVVGVRYLSDEAIPGGHTLDDAAAFGVAFAGAGADYLSLSQGGKFEDAAQPRVGEAAYPYTGPSGDACMPTVYSDARGPFGRQLQAAATVRAAVRAAGHETPVVAAGGINTFSLAESVLARGDADIIASARQSLADPDWFTKVRLGRGDEVRRCRLTNYCEALDQRHLPVTCQLWDHPNGANGPRLTIAPPWAR